MLGVCLVNLGVAQAFAINLTADAPKAVAPADFRGFKLRHDGIVRSYITFLTPVMKLPVGPWAEIIRSDFGIFGLLAS